jgi:hypothetical protein
MHRQDFDSDPTLDEPYTPTSARFCEYHFINGRQQPHFQLSQISGGYLTLHVLRSGSAIFFLHYSAFPCSISFISYIYIIHQGRQSDFLRVGGPLFATKDGRLCELFFECFCVLSGSSGFCVFFDIYHLGGCLITLFMSFYLLHAFFML